MFNLYAIKPQTIMGRAKNIKLADISQPAKIKQPATAGPTTAPDLPKPIAQPTPVLLISVGQAFAATP